MTDLPFSVGKTEDDSFPVSRHATLQEAEERIIDIEKSDPEGVQAGNYYLDGPEELINPPKPVLYWVALYEVDRAYGGPEEGGWWYDTGTLVVNPEIYRELGMPPRAFTDEDEALHYRVVMENLVDSKKLNEGKAKPSSVASRGDYLSAEMHEGSLPAFYPETNPHYE